MPPACSSVLVAGGFSLRSPEVFEVEDAYPLGLLDDDQHGSGVVEDEEPLDVPVAGVGRGVREGVFADGADGAVEFGPGVVGEGVPDGLNVRRVTERVHAVQAARSGGSACPIPVSYLPNPPISANPLAWRLFTAGLTLDDLVCLFESRNCVLGDLPPLRKHVQ